MSILEKVGPRYHLAVAKATEMRGIFDLLSKEITWIDLARNVTNIDFLE